jgi:hypothetical protein
MPDRQMIADLSGPLTNWNVAGTLGGSNRVESAVTQSLQIDYVEFYSDTLETTQEFFAEAFGWDFVDYGPDYRDIRGAGVGGGIERSPSKAPLVVLHADDLQAAYDQISAAGAEITKEIFNFPGGWRFEFREPGGTALAVWAKA